MVPTYTVHGACRCTAIKHTEDTGRCRTATVRTSFLGEPLALRSDNLVGLHARTDENPSSWYRTYFAGRITRQKAMQVFRGRTGLGGRFQWWPALVLVLAARSTIAGVAGSGQCTPVIAQRGSLRDCGGAYPPPEAECKAKTLANLTASTTGFTIRFDALLSQQNAAPYQMGLLSQCDCVCNR